MFIIIGGDGREYGPVDTETVRNWVSRNLANGRSRARRADTEPPEWRALGEFEEFSDLANMPPPLPSASPPPPPGAPGSPWAAENLHKPLAIDTAACIEDALRTRKPIRIFACISEGWNRAGEDYWAIFAVCVVYLLCVIAVSSVPYVGSLLQFALTPLLLGGVAYYIIGKLRKEPRTVGDVFAGFSRMSLHLWLASTVSSVLASLATIPGMILMGVGVWAGGFNVKGAAHFLKLLGKYLNQTASAPVAASALLDAFPFEWAATSGLFLVLGFLLTFGACLYFAVSWSFALPLVMDRRVGFWEAMRISRAVVTRQWWRVWGLMLVSGLMAFCGMFFCCVGFLFVLPVTMCAYYAAYLSLFGNMTLHEKRRE